MIENESLEKRHVLPRWLTIQAARVSGMFARPGLTRRSRTAELLRFENEAFLSQEFEHHLKLWKASKEPDRGEELLTVAMMANKLGAEEVIEAARTISAGADAGSALQDFAFDVVNGSLGTQELDHASSSGHPRVEIKRRKRLIALNPRDAMLLAETALFHANLGQLNHSSNLIRRAVALAPHSRFVLRSAARFYCHVDDPEQALAILRRTPRHQTDPWLKSAELAIASFTDMRISNWRKAKALAEDQSLNPLDRSELASELATLQFESGGRKAALKHVQIATLHPTENAVAQVEFLSERTGQFEREAFLPDISEAMEALAISHYRNGELRSALEACENWQQLEQFSIRPAIFGSFLSTARSNSVSRGIQLARTGLMSNPKNSMLHNNLAVLYAYDGQIDLARTHAERAKHSPEDRNFVATYATDGLILFRENRIEEATALYEIAIDEAVKSGRTDLAVRAYAFLAREMCRFEPSLSFRFAQEFDKIEARLKKFGLAMPRDIEFIRREFAESGSETLDLSISFKSFDERDIDRAIEG